MSTVCVVGHSDSFPSLGDLASCVVRLEVCSLLLEEIPADPSWTLCEREIDSVVSSP